MKERKLTKVLKDLLLACLNATLILVALCLWLAWQVSATINATAAEFASNLVSFEPMREEVRGLSGEIAALRKDLTAVGQRSGQAGSQTISAIQGRLSEIQSRASNAMDQIEAVATEPERLIDHAVDRVALQVKSGVGTFLQCQRDVDSGAAQ